LRIAARFWVWLIGPVGQQLLSLIIMGFGILTMFAIWGVDSGKWMGWWARKLVFSLWLGRVSGGRFYCRAGAALAAASGPQTYHLALAPIFGILS
jgi:hypothetical protein